MASYKNEQDLVFQEMEDRRRLAEAMEREQAWRRQWVGLGFSEAGFDDWFKLVKQFVKLDSNLVSVENYMEAFFERWKAKQKV